MAGELSVAFCSVTCTPVSCAVLALAKARGGYTEDLQVGLPSKPLTLPCRLPKVPCTICTGVPYHTNLTNLVHALYALTFLIIQTSWISWTAVQSAWSL